ncbi:MAG: YCF48-related protein [Fibrobacteria bacterium]
MQANKNILNRNWKRIAQRGGLAAFLGLASCLFETKTVDPNQPGYLSLDLSLKPNSNALFKTASADTAFRLDSVIIILTAPGATTLKNTYAVSGRSDSANIPVATKIYALAPLRTWKAKILSIDTSMNPNRRDTVHIDSVSFLIQPGDTAYVSKTANPVFSILRARMVSNSPASLPNSVKYLRIRVDGIMRDSSIIGPTLRSVDYANSNTGGAAGDSGTIIRTTNGGGNWAATPSGTTQNLYSVNFPAAANGWAVGIGGTVVHTTTGTSWFTVPSGTTQNLYGTYYTSNNNGWAVGDAGTIIKTTTGLAFSAQTSGTTQNLYAVYFSNTNNGNAVGAAGTILRTVNGGTNWTAQASGTTAKLRGVHFPASATGYVVGDGGLILKTTTSGATWSPLVSGTTANLNSVYFTSATAGYAVGDGGVILSTSDGTNWTLRASGTAQNLYGISWTTNGSDATAVGKVGTIASTTTGTSYALQLLGTKSFDVQLTYKYFTPNVSHTLLMEAIDTTAGTLRGYQVAKTIMLAPGKDSTVTPSSNLTKCGYSGSPACTP